MDLMSLKTSVKITLLVFALITQNKSQILSAFEVTDDSLETENGFLISTAVLGENNDEFTSESDVSLDKTTVKEEVITSNAISYTTDKSNTSEFLEVETEVANKANTNELKEVENAEVANIANASELVEVESSQIAIPIESNQDDRIVEPVKEILDSTQKTLEFLQQATQKLPEKEIITTYEPQLESETKLRLVEIEEQATQSIPDSTTKLQKDSTPSKDVTQLIVAEKTTTVPMKEELRELVKEELQDDESNETDSHLDEQNVNIATTDTLKTVEPMTEENRLQNKRNQPENITPTSSPDQKIQAKMLFNPGASNDSYRFSTTPQEGQRQRTPKINQPDEEDLIRYSYHPDSNQEKRPRINASKRDIVRSWLSEPYLRPPAAILVPLRIRPLARALAVWEEITKDGLEICDVLLIGYNDNGVGWMSRHNLSKNCSVVASSASGVNDLTTAFKKLIHKYRGTQQKADHGDAAMHACIRASKLVPYDSALVVITDTRPNDGYEVSDAIASLLVKRLKLYTIWTDPNKAKIDSDATVELKKLSQYTQGEFIDYSLPIHLENEANEEDTVWRSTEKPKEVIATPIKSETILLHYGRGSSVLSLPVDGSMRNLQVYVEGSAGLSAILYTPNGAQIELTNPQSVATFNQDSRFISAQPLMVEIVLPGWEKRGRESDSSLLQENSKRLRNVGSWRLAIRCDTCDYRATVATITPVAVEAFLLHTNVLRLRLRGPIGTVSDATLIDEGGSQIVKLPFSHQSSNIGGNQDANTGIVADVPLPEMEPATMFVKVQGKDGQGNAYTRISEPVYKTQQTRFRRASITFPEEVRPNSIETPELLLRQNPDVLIGDNSLGELTPDVLGRQTLVNTTNGVGTASTSSVSQATLLTTVQIGLSSRLYGAPGDSLQIHFEVSNYRERNILFTFRAQGNLRFLRGIRPTSQWISSGQTANVVVDVGITSSAANGARDLITFTATGLEEVSLSAYVYVITSAAVVFDVWIPELRYSIEGDCLFKMGENCNRYSWTANIYARDRDSGILRVSSSPVGLRYDANFIAGSREDVTGSYRATCCNTRLVLSAVDGYSNTNSYTIDVAYYFPPAVIAAICLSIFLFIALVAIIAMGVYLCVRRRQDSRHLPSYATPSRRDGGIQ